MAKDGLFKLHYDKRIKQVLHGAKGDCLSYLGRGDDRVGVHDSVWELFLHLGDEEGAHAGAGTTSKGMSQLETL